MECTAPKRRTTCLLGLSMVSGEPPLTQHRQDRAAGGGFQETEQRTHTHHHRQDTCGAG